jgi:hypothetical protein
VRHHHGNIRLENVGNPSRFLAIKGGNLTFGPGGEHCEFTVISFGGDVVGLRSVHDVGAVGVLNDGSAKPAASVGDGPHGQFHVHLA